MPSRGQFLKSRAVRLDDGDLRATLDAVSGLQKQPVESVEKGGKFSDAEDDPVAGWRPLRRQHIAILILVDQLEGSRGGVRDAQACAEIVSAGARVGHELVTGR